MEKITKDILQHLLSDELRGPHVSLYMPAVQAGQQTQQNPIHFKNAVREAESKLRERGMNVHEAETFLRTAMRSFDDVDFWQHQNAGLAVFIAEGQCYEFRLPIEFQPLVVVHNRFYIKPLLPAIADGERFYILALSKNRVRLFDCDSRHAHEIDMQDVPTSLADALGYELTKPDLSFHGAAGVSNPAERRPDRKGQVASAYEEDDKIEVHQFFKRLNPRLRRYLQNGAPLVVAGVEYLLGIYQQESDYEPIAGTIPGNFDVERPQTIHEQAWPIVEPYFAQARQDALTRFAELSGTGRAAIGLKEVTVAAIEGRIDTLFVARDAQRWGKVDAENRQVQIHEQPKPGDEELLDLVAANTLLKDGRVFVLAPEQIPGGQPQAAILRY